MTENAEGVAAPEADGKTNANAGGLSDTQRNAIGCFAVIAIAVVAFVVWGIFALRTTPLPVTPNAIVQGVADLDGTILQYDEEDQEFFTVYLDRYQVEIGGTDAENENALYVQIQLPTGPEGADVAARFASEVVAAITGHRKHNGAIRAFIDEEWGDLVNHDVYEGIRVQIDTYEEQRFVLLKIAGD